MSAQRDYQLVIEPASEIHRAWLNLVFECGGCGCRVVIVFPMGTDPLKGKPQCRSCGERQFFDHDGINRDWRMVH